MNKRTLIATAVTFLYDNDDLRGILNGNRKGSAVLRTVGDDHEPVSERRSTWPGGGGR